MIWPIIPIFLFRKLFYFKNNILLIPLNLNYVYCSILNNTTLTNLFVFLQNKQKLT